MTETPARDRVEPVDLQQEMQRSYIDYAMSVIVGRALPEVRDGLKPVHRRVLYAMYDQGFRPDRSYVKCARVVGEVMGNYHPHGDTSIYDALVRLAQPWSMRYPLVDGQGNFGSPGNDPAAAMRYCVVQETLVRTVDGTVSMGELAGGMAPNSEREIGLKVLDRNGDPVLASTVFHSGVHPVKTLTTTGGYSLTGTGNHPVLCLVSVLGVPTLLWKLLAEVRRGDRVVLQRTPREELDIPSAGDADAALLAGAFVSEGFVSERRAGFNNLDRDFFDAVVTAYDRHVGGRRYVSSRVIASGNVLHELDIQDLSALRTTDLGEMVGQRSAAKRVPAFVWQATTGTRRVFLQALFEGDGSSSLLPRNTIQVSYSTGSDRLAREVQHLLLEFGVVSSLCRYENGEIKVVVSNRRDARLFAQNVGFLGRKQVKLEAELAQAALVQGTDAWSPATTLTGFAGAGYAAAGPDTGDYVAAGYAAASPRLRFTIAVDAPGTYTLWLRGSAPDAGGDSLHYGLDGVGLTGATGQGGFNGSGWRWVKGGVPVAIPTAGEHTIEVWMREDGLRLDRVGRQRHPGDPHRGLVDHRAAGAQRSRGRPVVFLERHRGIRRKARRGQLCQ